MKKTTFLFTGSAVALIAGIFFFSGLPREAAARTRRGHLPGKSQPYFLFLSDIHLAADSPTSVYGQDAGMDLWHACRLKVDSILNSAQPPAFILYTGDLPQHGGVYHPDQRDRNLDSVLTGLHGMSAVKHTPLFYLPGNNDALGGDYCFFSDQSGQTPLSLVPGYSPYPYHAFNVSQKPAANGAYMLPGANLSSGYYTAHVMKGLRIISLNSVLWSNQVCNSCMVYQNCDSQQAAGTRQMAWLEQQLAMAAKTGDRVYVAMHVPPGADAFASRHNPANPVMMWKTAEGPTDWLTRFLQLVSRYRKTIAGMFYGHTHMDEFRLLYDGTANGTFMQVALSCPGISPMFGNNPGFKLVQIDPGTKRPMDFITYYTTVAPIQWQAPYRFSTLPGVKPGLSIQDALKQMTPEERKSALDSIYTVQHGGVAHDYDTLGLNVR